MMVILVNSMEAHNLFMNVKSVRLEGYSHLNPVTEEEGKLLD